jgi:hypothetical protein
MMNMAVVFSALGLLGLGLAAMLVLYLGLKGKFRSEAQKQRTRMEDLLAQLNSALEARSPVAEPPPAVERSQAPAAPASALNIHPCVRARRMLRLGETADQIASVLGLYRGEAALYVRVQEFRSRRFAELEGDTPFLN